MNRGGWTASHSSAAQSASSCTPRRDWCSAPRLSAATHECAIRDARMAPPPRGRLSAIVAHDGLAVAASWARGRAAVAASDRYLLLSVRPAGAAERAGLSAASLGPRAWRGGSLPSDPVVRENYPG